jgi:hypothetical protein
LLTKDRSEHNVPEYVSYDGIIRILEGTDNFFRQNFVANKKIQKILPVKTENI